MFVEAESATIRGVAPPGSGRISAVCDVDGVEPVLQFAPKLSCQRESLWKGPPIAGLVQMSKLLGSSGAPRMTSGVPVPLPLLLMVLLPVTITGRIKVGPWPLPLPLNRKLGLSPPPVAPALGWLKACCWVC